MSEREVMKKIKSNEFSLSDVHTSEKEILEKFKTANYHDFEDLVYRMELTYNESKAILDIKKFPSEKTSYTPPSGFYEISDNNETLELFLPNFVK